MGGSGRKGKRLDRGCSHLPPQGLQQPQPRGQGGRLLQVSPGRPGEPSPGAGVQQVWPGAPDPHSYLQKLTERKGPLR